MTRMPACITYTINWMITQPDNVLAVPTINVTHMTICKCFHFMPCPSSLALLLTIELLCLVLHIMLKNIDNECVELPMHNSKNHEEQNEFLDKLKA